LTSEKTINAMSGSSGTIRSYSVNLLKFSRTVSTTTRTLRIYVSTMNKAVNAMKSLDNQIINNQTKRNKAL
jgi:hypothetical protein